MFNNPLLGKPILNVDLGLKPAFESGKVRESFWIDGLGDNPVLLLVDTDRIGAYDQPHRMKDEKPAFYPGKGVIINAFNQKGEIRASNLMPTDFVPFSGEARKQIPPELWSRCSLHVPVKKRILVEAIVRTGCEGSMAKTAKEGKSLCGQKISPDLYKGQLLDRPMFTPTSKAPKGEKDKPYTLEEYFKEVGDKAIANYIYGMSVLLHLSLRADAAVAGLDHPDDKFEFGIFQEGMRINYNTRKCWDVKTSIDVFIRLCQQAGLSYDSWRKMPEFDLELFCEFAENNAQERTVGLIDERGSTDSSRFRPREHTILGRNLAYNGELELARVFLDEFWCKEWFRTQSKLTGKGGYDADSKQIVTLDDWVLAETGKRNLMTYLRFYDC